MPLGTYEEGLMFCPPNSAPSLATQMQQESPALSYTGLSYTGGLSLPMTATQAELSTFVDFRPDSTRNSRAINLNPAVPQGSRPNKFHQNCRSCNQLFPDYRQLANHVRINHQELLQCQECYQILGRFVLFFVLPIH
ncbi:hypothetical protein Vi05172_g11767 [Venturia inaequalis]|nr:hypothetical protein Vi05172_g11767 [Venturia inaequalis]